MVINATKLAALLFCGALGAVASDASTAADAGQNPARQAQAENPAPTATDSAAPTPTTESGKAANTDTAKKDASPANGKNKDQEGSFVPSVEISEDLSVSFPADI